MKYTIKQLQYFAAVADLGSITLASRELHISQPSISAAIAHLEEVFGVDLFVRHHSRGLSLTPAGERVLTIAKRLLRDAKYLSDFSRELMNEVSGRLSVGCILTLAPIFLPSLITGFTAKFPSVQIECHELDHGALVDGINSGLLDLAIAYDLTIPDGLEFTQIASFPPYIIVPPKHPFAARGAAYLRDLVDEPMIVLDLPHTREYFLSIFEQVGVSPNIVYRTSSPHMVRSLVANGLGYSLLNAPLKNDRALDGKPLRRLVMQDDIPSLKMGVVTVRSERIPRAVSEFVQYLRDTLVV